MMGKIKAHFMFHPMPDVKRKRQQQQQSTVFETKKGKYVYNRLYYDLSLIHLLCNQCERGRAFFVFPMPYLSQKMRTYKLQSVAIEMIIIKMKGKWIHTTRCAAWAAAGLEPWWWWWYNRKCLVAKPSAVNLNPRKSR